MSEVIEYRSALQDLLGRPVPSSEWRVWLDDDAVTREAPEGWIHLRSVREVCFALLTGRVIELSLDNDLDNPPGDERVFGTGFQVVDFLEEQHFVHDNPLWPRDGIVFHTANSSGRERMERAFEAMANRAGMEVERTRTPGGKPRYLVTATAA